MLFSGSRGAPYTCLQCQLRQAIFHTRRRCIDRTHIDTARSFSATPQPRNQEDDNPMRIPRQRDDRPYVYHHPLGRIVGAPGRRQRQGTQKLKIDAMKQPFEVIVMQDVKEPEERPPRPRNAHGGAVVSAADIEKEMAMEGKDPTQDEVNESINALRPDTTLLDGEQYRALAKSLTDGFTIEQLHGFFTRSLNLSAVEGDTVHLLRQQPSKLQTRYRRTQWRPGRTRPEKRLPLGTVVKKSEKTNKPKLVEQILRLTWNLAIHAEEQQVGELEMKLESWEMEYLFDLRRDDRGADATLMYETFIDSPFLLRACEIRPYRPHGILRISGRRQDAEEVATRLETKLPNIEVLGLKLGTFSTLLGTSGWPKTLDKLFREEDIQYVQKRTQTVIEQPRPSLLNIYGHLTERRQEARRLLLALLEMPTTDSIILVPDTAGIHKKAVPLPEGATTSLHLRHRRLELSRLVLPTAREEEREDKAPGRKGIHDASRSLMPSISVKMVKKLVDAALLSIPSSHRKVQSYWDYQGAKTSLWKVQICKVLHAEGGWGSSQFRRCRKMKMSEQAAWPRDLTVIDTQIRGLETFLSFFTPRQNQNVEQRTFLQTATLLVARLIPSPFADRDLKASMATPLPPVELIYRSYIASDGTPDVWLVGAQMMLEGQDFRIQLPSEVADLRFVRVNSLRARGTSMQQDADISAFTQTLRTSLRGSKYGSLVGEPQLRISLPAAVLRREKSGGENDTADAVSATYMFMGFEQRTTSEFSPVDVSALPAKMAPEVKDTLASFGERFYLQLKEVAAGTVGGRRTEVTLMYSPPPSREDQREDEGGKGEGEGATNDGSSSGTAGDDSSVVLDQDAVAERLVKLGLGVARVLTKIAAGEVQPLVRHESEIEVEDGPGGKRGDEKDGVDEGEGRKVRYTPDGEDL